MSNWNDPVLRDKLLNAYLDLFTERPRLYMNNLFVILSIFNLPKQPKPEDFKNLVCADSTINQRNLLYQLKEYNGQQEAIDFLTAQQKENLLKYDLAQAFLCLYTQYKNSKLDIPAILKKYNLPQTPKLEDFNGLLNAHSVYSNNSSNFNDATLLYQVMVNGTTAEVTEFLLKTGYDLTLDQYPDDGSLYTYPFVDEKKYTPEEREKIVNLLLDYGIISDLASDDGDIEAAHKFLLPATYRRYIELHLPYLLRSKAYAFPYVIKYMSDAIDPILINAINNRRYDINFSIGDGIELILLPLIEYATEKNKLDLYFLPILELAQDYEYYLVKGQLTDSKESLNDIFQHHDNINKALNLFEEYALQYQEKIKTQLLNYTIGDLAQLITQYL